MLTKDFYGKNGFVWWTGVVENIDDPLKLGSVQVRIIGIHSEDKSKVPTISLPWAQVMQAPNASNSVSVPRPGDWVFGFFQDGDFAQVPVVMGVFPGIESVQSAVVYQDVVVKKGSRNVPRTSQVYRTVGEPTTFRQSRGVMEGSLTDRLNKSLSHACDVKEPIEFAVRWARVQNSIIVQALVGVIKGLANSLGSDPSGLVNQAINFLKKIQTFLRWIQSILQVVQDYAYVAIRYAQIARAILDFILTLPERLRAFLRECLAKIVAGVFAVISALFSTEGFSELGELGDFENLSAEFETTLGELRNTTNEIYQTVALPGQFLDALINPSTPEAQSEAGKILDTTIVRIASNGEAINNQTQFNINSTVLP
jgi:hypothetical protein